MNVKEARTEIENLNQAENNLQKLLELSEEELESLADKLQMNQPIESIVNLVVYATKCYTGILCEKIEKAKLD